MAKKTVTAETKEIKAAEGNTVVAAETEIKVAEAPVKEIAEKKAVKPAAKKPAAKKAPAKKSAAKKPAAKKSPKKKVNTLDDITSKLWTKLEKADASAIEDTIAIQFYIWDMGTFFIAVKSGEKEITQATYNDKNGYVETSYDEMMKLAAGGYDYIAAITEGKFRYNGDLGKAVALKKLFD